MVLYDKDGVVSHGEVIDVMVAAGTRTFKVKNVHTGKTVTVTRSQIVK